MQRKMALKIAMILCALWIPMTAVAAGLNIGVVDVKRAFSQTKDGKTAIEKLEKEFGPRQLKLQKMEADLKAWGEEKATTIKMMGPEAQAKAKITAQAELNGRLQELQMLAQKYQQDITAREEALTKTVYTKLETELIRIAEQEKLDVILRAGTPSVIWSAPSLDITDQLIRRYEAAN
jgi:outer membrane protein